MVRRNTHRTGSIFCRSRLWGRKPSKPISRDLEPQKFPLRSITIFPPQDISEPRWYGYSTGKWEDDTTFIVQTVGLDERTWIDNVGRPHSSDLRVEERFHRVNHDLLELTLTIIDPTMYTKPWNALMKFPLRLQPADFDLREMLCSPSEQAEFDKQVSRPAIADSKKK